MSPTKKHNLKNLGSWGQKRKRKHAVQDEDKENLEPGGTATTSSSSLRSEITAQKRQRLQPPLQVKLRSSESAAAALTINPAIYARSGIAHPQLKFIMESGTCQCQDICFCNDDSDTSLEDAFESDVDWTDSDVNSDWDSDSDEDQYREQTQEVMIPDCPGTGDENHTLSAKATSSVIRQPPSLQDALAALDSLQILLKPPRAKGGGYKAPPKLNFYVAERLVAMRMLLHVYTSQHSAQGSSWIASSEQVAETIGRGPWMGRQLRRWTSAYIRDRQMLPVNAYGSWCRSRIQDEDLALEIQLHLQSKGKYMCAMDIVHYLDTPDVKSRHGIKHTVSLATAKRWLQKLGYRWTKSPTGQYVDGHEREDVVEHRQKCFLPWLESCLDDLRDWSSSNPNSEEVGPLPRAQKTVIWWQDESTFQAHDRRKIRWVHNTETAVPQPKGEGPTLMVSDIFSADYGYCRTHDGKKAARVLFKAGKARDGYFTNDNIVKQINTAIDIMHSEYPLDKHRLVVDNAKTHAKRPEASLSARKMPKGTPKEGSNWGVEVLERDKDGNVVYESNGKPRKMKVRMVDGKFRDGSPQSLYFPEGHPRAGVFKGMAVILEERGYKDAKSLPAECKNFKCEPGATACCCRRLLYNEPDFVKVESILETVCKSRGVDIVFLPKFHPELNPIEQVWGSAKRTYRLNPLSSREDDLERNVVAALESVTLESMRRYTNRALRFASAYRKGLNGKQAAWAGKKYTSHRGVPDGIMQELETNGL